MIETGEKIPSISLFSMTKDGPLEVSTDRYFSDKKVVLVAVPGAFTPTCHLNHLPGYTENSEEILSKGIDKIAVISVNDVYVMHAWEQENGGSKQIDYLADGSCLHQGNWNGS